MPRFWRTVFDEPLVPFAIIGGLFFVINGFRNSSEPKMTIEVKPQTVRALEQGQEELLGRTLTKREQQDLLDGYIDDEVLLQEAFRMGLERKDSRVRKRLLDVMRSTLDQKVPPPTRAELEAYFRENRDRYVVGEVITIDHVFFAFGSEDEPSDPASILQELRAGRDPAGLGDSLTFGQVIRNRSHEQLSRTFGREFADRVMQLPINEWNGPLESASGLHFVRVVERGEAPPPSFEQLEEYLTQDWLFRKRRELQAEKIQELRKRYRIVNAEDQ